MSTATAIKSTHKKLHAESITLAHGSGGKAMRDLIDEIFVKEFANDQLALLEDQARFDISSLQSHGDRLAMTTDSYVIDPLFFPGGDIGKLAVTGTVNDLVVSGAKPLYLTCGMILEEGLAVEDLRHIVRSMQTTAQQAGVKIVTGDTKVVHRGAADKLFINTAGIGVIPKEININSTHAKPGDAVIINGYVGDHGAAVVDARGEMSLNHTIETDCCPLNSLIESMLEICPNIHCMRDATRGGIATVLNEFAQSSQVGIRIHQDAIPVRSEVRGMCEILGLDPLYLANEGKIVTITPKAKAEALVNIMRSHSTGIHSAVIGEVIEAPKNTVILSTSFGGERIIDLLVGEQLPRIC